MGVFSTLDAATLQLSIAVFSALLAVMSFGLARALPEHGAVLRLWGGGMCCGAVAFSGYFLRGHAPAWLTLLAANLAVLGTPIFGLLAHARFLGRRVPLPLLFAVTAFGWAGPLATLLAGAPMAGAVLSMSLAWSALGLATAVLIARTPAAERRAGSWVSCAAFGALGGMLALRALSVALGPDAVAMGSSSPLQLLTLFTSCLFAICGTLGMMTMALDSARQHALERARRDDLTGALSRNAFARVAQQQLHAGRAMALLMIDIDHFKQVNDGHGHAGGDQVLIHAARLLASRCRSTDLVGRYGGEEFCVLLLDAGMHAAGEFADRLVRDARAAPVRLGNAECRYTISVGYALQAAGTREPPQAALSRLFAEADQALYAAKRSGRDRALGHAAPAGGTPGATMAPAAAHPA